jgi:hypothetical protein
VGVDKGCLTSTRNTSSGCATRNAGGVWMSSIGLSCTSRSATKQPHLKINAPPPPRPPPLLLLLLLFLHPNATCSQRVLLAERRRRRRSVAMFVQAHAFVLAEGDGQRPLCMVPRAQRPQASGCVCSKGPRAVCGDRPRDVIPGHAGVIVLET